MSTVLKKSCKKSSKIIIDKKKLSLFNFNLLQKVSSVDLSHSAFPYMSSKKILINKIECLAYKEIHENSKSIFKN